MACELYTIRPKHPKQPEDPGIPNYIIAAHVDRESLERLAELYFVDPRNRRKAGRLPEGELQGRYDPDLRLEDLEFIRASPTFLAKPYVEIVYPSILISPEPSL